MNPPTIWTSLHGSFGRSGFGIPRGVGLVTHDRFLLDRVSTEFVAFLGDGSAKPFASMEQWRAAKVKSMPQRGSVQTQGSPNPNNAKKLSYNEQRGLIAWKKPFWWRGNEALQAQCNDRIWPTCEP